MSVKSPIIQTESIEDALLQIVPNPSCRRSSCNGRGYIGIQVNPDGSKQILLCSCASFGVTPFVKAMKALGELRSQLTEEQHDLRDGIQKMEERIYRHTLFGAVKTGCRRVLRAFKTSQKGTPA